MHVIQGLGATSGRSSRAPCLCTGRSRFNAWRVGRSPDESWVILPFQQDFSLWIPMINFNDPVDTGLMLDVNIPMLNSNVGCVYRVYRSSEKNQWPFWKVTSWVERWPTLWVLRINKKTHHIITSWKSMGAHGCPMGYSTLCGLTTSSFGPGLQLASLPPPFVWRTIPAPSCGAGDRQSHRLCKPAKKKHGST